jgi:NOL1/NOP2/fmu family ribosome biogenesis protein
LLGTIEKNLFEPSQHLAMALKKDDFAQSISLKADDMRVRKYLKGETIEYDSTYKGWVLICVEDCPLGFGKITDRKIKNKLPKGYQR